MSDNTAVCVGRVSVMSRLYSYCDGRWQESFALKQLNSLDSLEEFDIGFVNNY